MKKEIKVQREILSAAKKVFSKWGINKTTLEDIAKEAGKGKSTLYYYYKNKDEILKSVVVEEIKSLQKKSFQIAGNYISTKEKLKSYISNILAGMRNSVSVYPLLAGEIKGNKEFIDKISYIVKNEEKIILEKVLLEGLDKGELDFFSRSELKNVAESLVKLVHSLMIQFIFDKDDKKETDLIIDLIIRGM